MTGDEGEEEAEAAARRRAARRASRTGPYVSGRTASGGSDKAA